MKAVKLDGEKGKQKPFGKQKHLEQVLKKNYLSIELNLEQAGKRKAKQR